MPIRLAGTSATPAPDGPLKRSAKKGVAAKKGCAHLRLVPNRPGRHKLETAVIGLAAVTIILLPGPMCRFILGCEGVMLPLS